MNNHGITIIHDNWLTEQIKADSFFVKMNTKHTDKNALQSLNNVLQQSPVFAYAKIPVTDTRNVAILAAKGFALVDTNVTLQKNIPQKKALIANKSIRLADHADAKEVSAIARKSFSFSRFHLDSNIPAKTANAVKAAWSKSYFLGKRGNAMIIAKKAGSIGGFLQLIFDQKNKVLIIDLIAVEKKFRGEGLARDMINFAQNQFHEFEIFRVGTQIANLPSLKLYESLGFSIDSAHYVLHYHN